MPKHWTSSIFVGLVSAFLVTAIIQQMWNVGWEKAAVVGLVFFIMGIVFSEIFRRTIRSEEDWVGDKDEANHSNTPSP